MKNNKIRTTFLSLTLAILPCITHADSADDLMDVMDVEKQMLGGFEAMLPMVDQMALQLSLSDTEKEELLNIYRTWFEDDIDREKLVKGTTDLYRQAFTNDEIKEMLAFFSSPTGQKVIQQSPTLMQEGAKLGMIEAQAKQSLLLARLNPFIEEHMQASNTLESVNQSAKEKSIVNNLRMLASAADQYYLENGVKEATLDQLVGPNAYIKNLKPVDGEDYSELVISLDTKEWVITSASGIKVSYPLK
jgi:hypothetical protein